jgi:MFS family permease
MLALPPMRRRGGLVAALAVDSVGTGLFLPFTIVYFLHTTSLSLAVIGAGLSVSRLVTLPTPVFVGPLIDRFGARRVFATGDLLGAAGFVGYLFVQDTWQLVLAAIVVSAGQATFWTASRSLVRDITEESERPRWFAFQSMVRNGGFGLGGIIGSAALGIGDRWVYLGFAGLNAVSFLVAALLVLRWRPVSTGAVPAKAAPAVSHGYLGSLKDRALMAVTGINLGFVLCVNVLNVLLVVYIVTVLAEPAWLGGAVFTVNTILVSTVQGMVTKAARRLSHPAVLRAAAGCWALSFAVFWLLAVAPRWTVVPGVFVGIIVFTLAEMLQGPVVNALVVDIAPEGAHGRYAAVFQLSWSLGAAIAPAALTWLLSQGVGPTWFALLAVCAAVVIAVQRLGSMVRTR